MSQEPSDRTPPVDSASWPTVGKVVHQQKPVVAVDEIQTLAQRRTVYHARLRQCRVCLRAGAPRKDEPGRHKLAQLTRDAEYLLLTDVHVH